MPQQERIASSSNKSVVASDESSAVADVLENTLWNRQLGAMSEEIVAALVCQIFEGNFFFPFTHTDPSTLPSPVMSSSVSTFLRVSTCLLAYCRV